ncbi:hypothetical protein BJY52DRAFT_1213836 [Lactarius psammicola]|nr:hypothetical protein BJY52DRAFT_1213836 [Lactarius psammicola]
MWIDARLQANTTKNNKLSIFEMMQLHETQIDGGALSALSNCNIYSLFTFPESDNNNDNNDDNLDGDAVLDYCSVPHFGGVNRIRVQSLPARQPLPAPSYPYYVASWAESGKVHIWDVRPLIYALDTPGANVDKGRTKKSRYSEEAYGRTEGFAMDLAGLNYELQ